MFAMPHADHKRTSLTGRNDQFGIVTEQNHQPVGAAQLARRFRDGGEALRLVGREPLGERR